MNSIERISSEIDALTVPPFDFFAVHSRSAERRSKPRRQLLAAVILTVLMPAFALAAVHYWPVRVDEAGNGSLQIYAQHVSGTWRGGARALQQMQQIADTAPYRVIWPSELPPYAVLGAVFSAESEVTLVSYRCPQKRFIQFLVMPRQMPIVGATQKLPIRLKLLPKLHHYEWTAGAERVRLNTNCLSGSEVARIRSAMISAGATRR